MKRKEKKRKEKKRKEKKTNETNLTNFSEKRNRIGSEACGDQHGVDGEREEDV